MDSKTKGILLGVAGIILWFMPLAYISFLGMEGYQAGHHVGGIAYLLLISSLCYAIFSWMEQHQLRIIAASIATGISILFLVQAGTSVAWGLLVLILVSAVSIWFAVVDNKIQKVQQTITEET